MIDGFPTIDQLAKERRAIARTPRLQVSVHADVRDRGTDYTVIVRRFPSGAPVAEEHIEGLYRPDDERGALVALASSIASVLGEIARHGPNLDEGAS